MLYTMLMIFSSTLENNYDLFNLAQPWKFGYGLDAMSRLGTEWMTITMQTRKTFDHHR
jgi:hypothetical protein